jgi:hypothetical protein
VTVPESRDEGLKSMLADHEPRAARPTSPRRAVSSFSAPAAWLVAPMFLAASASGILLVLRGPDRFFAWALASLFALALLWILISVFFPAAVERTCPSCGRESLRGLDPKSTRGVLCDACGHLDPYQSSFLFAEEEGTVAAIVRAERAGSSTQVGRGGKS